jgi:hypothetical protein
MLVLRRAGVVLIVVVLVLALGLGLGGAFAGAKKKHKKKGHAWGAKITLRHPSPTRFTGTVDSNFAACFKGRLVNLFFTDPNGNTALLSVQRADGKGRYEINLTQAAYLGVYQAQAAHERIRALKRPQTCKEAVSGIFGI